MKRKRIIISAICIFSALFLLSLTIFFTNQTSPKSIANAFLAKVYSGTLVQAEKLMDENQFFSESKINQYVNETYHPFLTENGKQTGIINQTLLRGISLSLQTKNPVSISKISLEPYETDEGGTWFKFKVDSRYLDANKQHTCSYTGKIHLTDENGPWLINRVIEESVFVSN
ncbi:MAG: hypothetical protein ACK5JF_04675 [Oscillospiraceae bacterium]